MDLRGSALGGFHHRGVPRAILSLGPAQYALIILICARHDVRCAAIVLPVLQLNLCRTSALPRNNRLPPSRNSPPTSPPTSPASLRPLAHQDVVPTRPQGIAARIRYVVNVMVSVSARLVSVAA